MQMEYSRFLFGLVGIEDGSHWNFSLLITVEVRSVGFLNYNNIYIQQMKLTCIPDLCVTGP